MGLSAKTEFEVCPGCGVSLPKEIGPTHRYIGASAGCWAVFSALNNAGEPPLTLAPTNILLVDAYAVQHPGQPSPQAVQSVAVHLLALYGVLVKDIGVDQAVWVKQRALRPGKSGKQGRFTWLSPPPLAETLTVVDIVNGATPAARTELVARYVTQVWEMWAQKHAAVIADWYETFVAGDPA
ncbi:MAG: hypothetical protein KDJ97_35050 [Anaerolineae bacterium]|nr:hypothetical protein [Anaerolineae bacterium]